MSGVKNFYQDYYLFIIYIIPSNLLIELTRNADLCYYFYATTILV